MKKSLYCLIICLYSVFPLHGIDYTDIIGSTDRENNPFIIRVLGSVGLNERIEIVRALGKRDDPYIADILSSLISRCSGKRKEEVEYLIRVLVHNMFDPGLPEEILLSRLLANRDVLVSMLYRIHIFDDPMLRSHLLRIIPYFHDASLNALLMSEGQRLLSICRAENGMPGTLIDYEIEVFLDIAAIVGTDDFLDICLSFRYCSRSKRVSKKANETSKVIAGK
ncbi:MAG: hypothetical protein JW881_01135 [Spirochaetales bacterium]|nr:hypothetical protein [Spirochaetales bacterium]